MNTTTPRKDRQQFLDPHAIGAHYWACDDKGVCCEGVVFDWSGAVILDTPEKVAEANARMDRWGWDYENYWRLGDACFFRVIA